MSRVEMSKFVEKMNLKNMTPDVSIKDKYLENSEVNRPALPLTGYFDYFDKERIQIIGYIEYTFLERMTPERKEEIYTKLLECGFPCLIFCRNLEPEPTLLEKATKMQIPVFVSEKVTSAFTAEVIRWLNVELAPCISIHGVLVDVYGVGVLIMGESGIGKSESALELVKRGHRLVSDDVVEIHKVSDDTLVGMAPDITRHFIELRGIGIVDVKTLFGVMSVRETQSIDLMITLEEWSRERDYERLGLDEEYTEMLGNQVACHRIPIRPGRNLAIIVETAAINYRQRKLGYNAAQELYKRVQENLARK